MGSYVYLQEMVQNSHACQVYKFLAKKKVKFLNFNKKF